MTERYRGVPGGDGIGGGSLDARRSGAVVRGAILADLTPVRPLPAPLRRALVLLPAGVLLLAAQPLFYGLRGDAAALGVVRLWGLSAGQSLLGLLFIAAALREAVPGRPLPRTPLLFALGALVSVVVTFVTWQGSATVVPPGHVAFYWGVCFTRPVLIGFPVMAIALALAWRAYPLRAALVGAFAGLGAGLMTDAGWRTFCHVSDPVHVLSAHLAAVLALSAAGAAVAALLDRLRR
jgi:hypothetical protein